MTYFMVFIETPIFTKLVQTLLTDDEYQEFQIYLADNPEAGPVIKESGGLRKVRWKQAGKGKSGGVRVIYYYVTVASQLKMLLIYPKNEQDNLTDAQLQALKSIVERW